MSTDSPIPQRTISLSVHGDHAGAQVTYSYWSPIKGQDFHDAPQCDLLYSRPTRFLFVLDYWSTLNGWTITRTVPRHGSPELPTQIGPDHLSVSNCNSHMGGETIHFAIEYKNTRTGHSMSIDPQEGNIPGTD